jgi:hypothetical protein
MKYALWSEVLLRMERRMLEAREPQLSADERAAIESYLRRNAG